MPRSAAATAKDPATYEQALAELDRLVAQMEGGQLPLDELLELELLDVSPELLLELDELPVPTSHAAV